MPGGLSEAREIQHQESREGRESHDEKKRNEGPLKKTKKELQEEELAEDEAITNGATAVVADTGDLRRRRAVVDGKRWGNRRSNRRRFL